MGARSSSEIEHEIDELRVDTDRVLTELESRFRDATDVRAQAEHHPLAVGTVGLAMLGGLGVTGFAVYSAVSHRPAPKERSWMARRRIELEEGRGEGLLKRVLWAFLTTFLVTTAAFTARKLSATIWTRTMKERPPTKGS